MRERLITNPLTSSTTEDHPRVCGKDIMSYSYKPAPIGSPPRMRERQQASPQTPRLSRITPAYAGKTSYVCRRRNSP
mgnify:CR=1 FL=1